MTDDDDTDPDAPLPANVAAKPMKPPAPRAGSVPHKDPLHGKTLAAILDELVAAYGFAVLAEKVPIHCFADNPRVSSSLKFLRRTPWAREKVESLYLWHLRELKRAARRAAPAAVAGVAVDAADAADDDADGAGDDGGER